MSAIVKCGFSLRENGEVVLLRKMAIMIDGAGIKTAASSLVVRYIYIYIYPNGGGNLARCLVSHRLHLSAYQSCVARGCLLSLPAVISTKTVIFYVPHPPPSSSSSSRLPPPR